MPAGGIEIAQRHRLQRGLGVQCRLEQRRVETLEASPEARDSLGKNCDQRTALELGRDYLARAPHLGALAALDVQRADQRAQPAYHRPAADFRFGDESRGESRVDDEDVEPGDVIEHQHAAAGKLLRCVLFAHGHGEDGEQRVRPTALFHLPFRFGKFRVEQPRDSETAQQVKHEPCQADQAKRNRSAV